MRILPLLMGLLLCGQSLWAAPPNPYEVEIIQEQAIRSFEEMMQVWKEELYFEMYEMGQRQSKILLNKPDFAQRMVELKWKPDLQGEVIESIEVEYRNFIRMTVVIPFGHKVNQERKMKKRFIFHLTYEENNWRYDLKTFVRAPFSGHYVGNEDFKPKSDAAAPIKLKAPSSKKTGPKPKANTTLPKAPEVVEPDAEAETVNPEVDAEQEPQNP